MVNRCHGSGHQRYSARGIKVCEHWRKSFLTFLEDMGPCPDGLSLDRIDNDGDYAPENCRWATWEQQERNKKSCIWLVFNGVKKHLKDWAEELNISKNTLYSRAHKGWPVDLILTKQSLKGKNRWGEIQLERR
jgi:hypothetical protein